MRWTKHFVATADTLNITITVVFHPDEHATRSRSIDQKPRFLMTTRFCASCMAGVGLNPAHSRLALPGCAQSRLAFCAGPNHDCTVLVNERGEVVPKREAEVPSDDSQLRTTSLAKRPFAPAVLPAQAGLRDGLAVSSLVGSFMPSSARVGPGSRA